MKTQLSLMMVLFVVTIGFSQNDIWKRTSNSKNLQKNKSTASYLPGNILYELDIEQMKKTLKASPLRSKSSKGSGKVMSFPNDNGIMESYTILESPVMSPELSAQYPDIKSYVGYGIEDPTATIHFSVSPSGLQTMRLSGRSKAVFIEPYTIDGNTYSVYTKDSKISEIKRFTCGAIEDDHQKSTQGIRAKNADDGRLRTYDLAISTTDEYTAFYGGVAQAQAAINATINRVNAIFERDFSITLNLVHTKIYPNNRETPDPYNFVRRGRNIITNYSTMLQRVLDAERVDNNPINYDIGHLFGGVDSSGNAGEIASVCDADNKGKGYTTSREPRGDTFDIDFVAHEMGHQFGANHTWTFGPNERTNRQVEPGSGTTIMGYAGITGANTDVQQNSDAYFHAVSIKQVTDFVKASQCATVTNTRNNVPVVNAGADYTIPKGTPFVLTGEGRDADARDNLTYCWEQMDEDDARTKLPTKNATTGVAFRSYSPKASKKRYFPRLSTIKKGKTAWKWEAVPDVARALNFRLTVRDRREGVGANKSDDMRVNVIEAAGPFKVTNLNRKHIRLRPNTMHTLTWDVAETNRNGINAANVDILLSEDEGKTYPLNKALARNVRNDGEHEVRLPETLAKKYRIMVKPVNNIFFDITNENFEIANCIDATITIRLDKYPKETTWKIVDSNNNIVSEGGPYKDDQKETEIVLPDCFIPGRYTFTINDSQNDGICCGYGRGSYAITSGGNPLISGAENIGSSESKEFEIAAPAVVARNGINNKNEVTKVYPNPIINNGILNVATPSDNTLFAIHDVLGRKVLQGKINNNNKIDLNSLKAGLYMVTLDLDGKKFVHQVVKQ
ncbi:putative secreted protein (Por secretion system target) [Aquimarina sp. MAR_2010_214]|uniref:zinc-dependent metalloprotease n=1 Tax=Aquimarina sp. MAR_2010_214 TaxID=1250026 RepID=UPI000C704EBA|nr:zinc-dependent metalloprotease [Aquimarina sp. MAR_2010_214]PKV51046.1 putative secreted protein (Por secretion system target) [Aquimarina sp. MAR_2010_214]